MAARRQDQPDQLNAPKANGAAVEAPSPQLYARIETLLLDYVHAIDDGDAARWPAFFTDDGIYHILTRDSFDAGQLLGVMYCQGRGMMQDRMLALETANIFEPHTYCHILSRPQLGEVTDNGIAVRTNFQVLRTLQGRQTELFAAGKYLDHIVADGQDLRFKSRKVVLESRQIDILLVLPL